MTIDFYQLPHEGIRNLVPYKPGKSIAELAREKGITDIIKMASNENPLGCSPLALTALHAMSSHLVATYPSPNNHPLIPKLAAKYQVKTEQIFVSNGTDHLFGELLKCFALHTQRLMLTHDYAFNTYAVQAHSLNIPVLSVAIKPNWHVDIEALIAACTPEVGILFLANPNNPTGQLIPQEEIKYLLENIPITTIVVLDEAYYEFCTFANQINSIDWLEEHPNLVITRTFSKIYGLAGLRLGYAITNPEIVAILQRVQLPFTLNQAALTAAHAALDDDAFIIRSLETNRLGKEQLSSGFNKLGLHYLPSACNFLTFDCKEDGARLYNFMLDKGIIIRPLHAYAMNNYLRVSISTKEHNTRFLEALASYYH
ncbi:MAG: histidinol-phosphate transaminase [Legionella sp.]|jgi:histidinol-phosphate aminotransferase